MIRLAAFFAALWALLFVTGLVIGPMAVPALNTLLEIVL